MYEIIHVMNTCYGKIDQYGARSSKILNRIDKSKYVFASSNAITDFSSLTIIGKTFPVQLIGLLFQLLGKPELKRRLIWRSFDHRLYKKLKTMDLSGLHIVHTWEFIPKSVQYLRKSVPGVQIIRDVVINRKNEYWSGVPIIDENYYADIFLSPSAFSTEWLLSEGIPKSKIREIPFGVDSDVFSPKTDMKSAKNRPVRFSFSGGVSKRKGVDTLLTAWKLCNFQNAELHFYGTIRNDVKKYIDEDESVTYHGHVYLPDELNKNDVFIFPSILEGSAKSVYEALACGLPVITTPESGSIVEDGVDGFIVEKNQPLLLKERMCFLYENQEERMIMSHNAREKSTAYTWDRYAQTIISVYNEALMSRK